MHVSQISYPAETQVRGNGAGRSGRLHRCGAAAVGGICVADGRRQPAPLWNSRLGQRHLGGAPSQHGSIPSLAFFTWTVNKEVKGCVYKQRQKKMQFPQLKRIEKHYWNKEQKIRNKVERKFLKAMRFSKGKSSEKRNRSMAPISDTITCWTPACRVYTNQHK